MVATQWSVVSSAMLATDATFQLEMVWLKMNAPLNML